MQLLLASASPRRHEILTQLRIAHRVLHVPAPPGEDEPRLPGEPAADYVRRTAREKAVRAAHWLRTPAAHAAQAGLPSAAHALILAADTAVILEEDILGKPADRAAAEASLRRLSGRSHAVHTALAVIPGTGTARDVLETVQISEVQFAELTPAEITAYCAGDEAMGKAGAYAIQGMAGAFVRHLAGSHTGVMGLPAHETVMLLRRAGYHWP